MARKKSLTKRWSPHSFKPPHAIERWGVYQDLVESMRKVGWKGRPLIVAVRGKVRRAITGSHRTAAARKVGLKRVPVIPVSGKKIWDAIKKWDTAWLDYSDFIEVLPKEVRSIFKEDLR